MRLVVCAKQIGAQDAEDRLENRNGDEPDNEHVERAQGAVDQHLVDDDLEEQRRDERKQLEEERGGEDLAEQIAVFVDGAEEPADVEAARKIRSAPRDRPSAQDGRPRPPRTLRAT